MAFLPFFKYPFMEVNWKLIETRMECLHWKPGGWIHARDDFGVERKSMAKLHPLRKLLKLFNALNLAT